MDSQHVALVATAVVSSCVAAGLLWYNWNRFFQTPPHCTAPVAPDRASEEDLDKPLKLYQGLSNIKGPSGSLSTFCLKLETVLRVAKVPFVSKAGSVMSAPKQKIPYAVHGSTQLCDSADIVRYVLRSFTKGGDMVESRRSEDAAGFLGDLVLPGAMTPAQLATARAVEAVVEQRLYYHTVLARWVDDEANFALLRKLFFGDMPLPLQWILIPMIRRSVFDGLQRQGLIAHSHEDVHRREEEDWDTVAALVPGTAKDPGFLGGHGPCVQDCTLFAQIDEVINSPLRSHGKKYLLAKHDKLVAYCDKMRARFFADRGPPVAEVRNDNAVIFE